MLPSVYLIKRNDIYNNEYKIGKGSPEKRKRELQTGSAQQLLLISYYESKYASKIEKALHNRYSYCKIHGEWFNLQLKDELEFLANCKKIENNLIFLEENKI
ncbi:MAG: GIY-YIG nuclease family protein [bacterium]